jgi:hypothetical protein
MTSFVYYTLITFVTQQHWNKLRLDGRTSQRVRYLSFGVSCNWIITTKNLQNNLWTVGLLDCRLGVPPIGAGSWDVDSPKQH